MTSTTPYPTSLRLLRGLDAVRGAIASMDDALRDAALGIVTPEDRKTFRKAFGRISREA